MVIWSLILVLLVALLGAYFAQRLLVKLLVRGIKSSKLQIKVGHVGWLSLSDIRLSLKLEKLTVSARCNAGWMTSSLFNSKAGKLLTVLLSDVNIQVYRKTVLASFGEANSQTHGPNRTTAEALSPYLVTAIKHFGLTVSEVSVNIGDDEADKTVKFPLVYTSLESLHLSCSAGAICSQSVALNIKIENAAVKVMKSQAAVTVADKDVDVTEGSHAPYVASICLHAAAYIEVDPHSRSLKAVDITILTPNIELQEDFLDVVLIPSSKSKTKHVERDHVDDSTLAEDTAASTKPKKMKQVLTNKHETSEAVGKMLMKTLVGFNFLVQGTKILLCRRTHSRGFCIVNETLEVAYKKENDEYKLSAKIANMAGHCVRTKFLGLQQFHTEVKVDKDMVEVYVRVVFPFFDYLRVDFEYWRDKLKNLLAKRFKTTPDEIPEKPIDDIEPTTDPLHNRQLKLNAEVVSFLFASTLPQNKGFRTGFQSLTISSSSVNSHQFDNLALNCELKQVFSCTKYCKVNIDSLSPTEHHWNTILYCNSLIVKMKKPEDSLQADVSLNFLRGEWSMDLVQYLVETVVSIQSYKALFPGQEYITDDITVPAEHSEHQNLLAKMELNILVSHVNLFACNSVGVCLMTRINEAKAQYDKRTMTSSLSGCKLVYLNRSDQNFKLADPEIVRYTVAYIHLVAIACNITKRQLQFMLHNQVSFKWSPEFYMCLWTAIEDGIRMKKQLHAFFSGDEESEEYTKQQNHSQPQHQEPQGDANSDKPKKLAIGVAVTAGVEVIIVVNRGHELKVTAPVLNLQIVESAIKLNTDSIVAACNGVEILDAQALSISITDSYKRLQLERWALAELDQKKNKAIVVNLGSVNVLFRYEFDFASCLEETINTVKWLKLVMKLKKSEFTASSPLYPDFSLKVQFISFAICDDPFEAKLGDNYALMMDERIESDRRLQAMEAKVEELRSQNKFISGSKLDELYHSLLVKNSEIYLKRSKQLYESVDITKRPLFTVKVNDIEILAMADSIYNGTENVLKHMKEIDPDSPIPADIEFSTLWGRSINVRVDKVTLSLRDYPLPLIEVKEAKIFGRLLGAEAIGSHRAIRHCDVVLEKPWNGATVERNMNTLKFFHDLSAGFNKLKIAYGVCWENPLAQLAKSIDMIHEPSVDPSFPLPFWDKLRLLFHGRVTALVDELKIIYPVSLDPYNTDHLLDLTVLNAQTDWTNGKWIIKGDVDLYARTETCVEDSCLLHVPQLRLSMGTKWLARGDPNAHHDAEPCAPDKIPEFSHEDHDSYKSFRSTGVEFSFKLESNPNPGQAIPSCQFYNSTIRFLNAFQNCLTANTIPNRRGKIFKVTAPRKPQMSKHIRSMSLSVYLPNFSVSYWMSQNRQKGFNLTADLLTLTSNYSQKPKPPIDNLIRKPQTDWVMDKFHSELKQCIVNLCEYDPQYAPEPSTSAMCIRSVSHLDQSNAAMKVVRPKQHPALLKSLTLDNIDRKKLAWTPTSSEASMPILEEVEMARMEKGSIKSAPAPTFKPDSDRKMAELIRVDRVTYHRTETSVLEQTAENEQLPAVHKLRLYDSKIQWTVSNRDICFAIFEGYQNYQALQNNLSAHALKDYSNEINGKQKRAQYGQSRSRSSSLLSHSTSTAPLFGDSRVHDLLQQLVNESESKFVVHSEETEPENTAHQLRGYTISQKEDVDVKNLQVELFRTQVRFHGVENPGYILISAAKGNLVQCLCRPLWCRDVLKNKTTWLASVEGMQYFSTMVTSVTNEVWLTRDQIDEEPSADHSPVAEMLASSSSQPPVGGVLSVFDHVSGTNVELQRIISRCKCQLFYASYGPVNMNEVKEIPITPPKQETGFMEAEEGSNTFTLLHHDVCISTNASQYALILDIVNKLLLHTIPKSKETTEKIESMKFALQLYSDESDSKTPILERQSKIRQLVAALKQLEKDQFLFKKALLVELDDHQRTCIESDMNYLKVEIDKCKEEIWASNLDLSIMISCYYQLQLQGTNQAKSAKSARADKIIETRRNEVCFMHASWRLTEEDGQVGLADLALRNFVYTKLNFNDDSGSHQFELGWINVTNLIPNSVYREVIQVQERGGHPRRFVLRIYSKDKAPVGGIGVKEHFEVNLEPLSIQVTHKFYQSMMAFFFPPNQEKDKDSSSKEVQRRSSVKSASSSARLESMKDVEIMRERASNNQLFCYIKFPEVPIRVSYKGSKAKNISDINNFIFITPTLEYHNETWTWKDLVERLKVDLRGVLIGQALKQKLTVHNKSKFYVDNGSGSSSLNGSEMHDEEKSRLLLGDLSAEPKPAKKGFSLHRHHK